MEVFSGNRRAEIELETIECPVCGSPRQRKLFDVPPSNPLEGVGSFGIVQCESCGLVFTNPRPRESDLPRFYGETYYGPKHRRFVGPLEWIETAFRRRRIRNIERFKRGGRILDVGCGRAQMLLLMQKQGWEVHGTELTPESAKDAQETLGAAVRVGELTQLHFPDRFFDCVTLWYVFEHVYHPRPLLNEISRIIKPGGLLVIGVHNYDCRMARFGGRNWFNFDAPHHTLHFTLPQLQKLLAEYGFKSAYTSHLSWEFDPYCWLQTLYNRLGFEHNLLYTMIRRRDWWRRFGFRKFLQAGAVSLLLPFLTLAALVLAVLDGWAKHNGTLVDYSIRES